MSMKTASSGCGGGTQHSHDSEGTQEAVKKCPLTVQQKTRQQSHRAE